jgi:HAD superfamily hydrolase (TIGR01509 family)
MDRPANAPQPALPAALIFDVDGTLADTEEAHRLSFNQTFDHFGTGWHWNAADYTHLLKVTGGKERMAAYAASVTLAAGDRAPLATAIAQWHADKTQRYAAMVANGAVPLRPGVAALLAEAQQRGLRLAIATTTTRANIDALLQAHFGAHGAAMFEAIACGDMVRAKKPAPDVYLLALQQLGLGAAQAVAFEDSVPGLQSAVAAGLWTVVTPNRWTEGGDFTAAGCVLPSLAADDGSGSGSGSGSDGDRDRDRHIANAAPSASLLDRLAARWHAAARAEPHQNAGPQAAPSAARGAASTAWS